MGRSARRAQGASTLPTAVGGKLAMYSLLVPVRSSELLGALTAPIGRGRFIASS